LIAATDLGVALRRPPTNGEASGALLDLLRSGVPSVVADTGSFAEFPEGVVRKVPWKWNDDAAGVRALTRALLDLAADRAGREALGLAARNHVRDHHAWPRIAARYAAVIEQSGGLFRGPHRARARSRAVHRFGSHHERGAR
jgi:glycosyltransferase involved in cell wall biosynthesis